jgi:hypothetical protein
MAIGQRPAQATEPHDIGMPNGGTQHFWMSSPDHKLDSITSGQAIELSTAQREVLAIVGDRFTMQKPGHDIDELGQPPRTFRRCGPLTAEVLPLARRMTGTDSEQDAARGKKVQRGRVRRDVHRFADTGLDHVGAEFQRPGHRGSAAQGRPRGGTRARMITRKQGMEPRGLQAARQVQP